MKKKATITGNFVFHDYGIVIVLKVFSALTSPKADVLAFLRFVAAFSWGNCVPDSQNHRN